MNDYRDEGQGTRGAGQEASATALPSLSGEGLGVRSEVLLQVTDLKKHYPIEKGLLRKVVGHVKAVDGVSFHIDRMETLGLVGESGSGKTTLGRTLLRAVEPTSGAIRFSPRDGNAVEVTTLDKEQLRLLRRKVQIIFQNPYSSLDPRKTVMQIIGEPLILHKVAAGDELEARVRSLMEMVGLEARFINRFPHAFSGGQRQRIGIARSLALNPEFVIADEPVSALDVSIQAQILNLLHDLRSELNLSFLFISHGLNVIRHVSDRVAVMYVGRMVELAEVNALFARPLHPYTEALLAAIPLPNPELRRRRIPLEGEIANPADPPPGCAFHPRCRYATDICKQIVPAWEEIEPNHFVACHHAATLELTGVPD